MVTRTKSKPADLDFEQVEMVANFSDYSADYPKLSFQDVAKKLGVNFSQSKNGKAWEKECKEAFENNRPAKAFDSLLETYSSLGDSSGIIVRNLKKNGQRGYSQKTRWRIAKSRQEST